MSEEERIKKDIALFEQSLVELDSLSLTSSEAVVVAQAKRYYEGYEILSREGRLLYRIWLYKLRTWIDRWNKAKEMKGEAEFVKDF